MDKFNISHSCPFLVCSITEVIINQFSSNLMIRFNGTRARPSRNTTHIRSWIIELWLLFISHFAILTFPHYKSLDHNLVFPSRHMKTLLRYLNVVWYHSNLVYWVIANWTAADLLHIQYVCSQIWYLGIWLNAFTIR